MANGDSDNEAYRVLQYLAGLVSARPDLLSEPRRRWVADGLPAAPAADGPTAMAQLRYIRDHVHSLVVAADSVTYVQRWASGQDRETVVFGVPTGSGDDDVVGVGRGLRLPVRSPEETVEDSATVAALRRLRDRLDEDLPPQEEDRYR